MDDLVTREDLPVISKQEMKKTHKNQHNVNATIYKNGKKVTKKVKK